MNYGLYSSNHVTMWSKVNERLIKDEASLNIGDHLFPKRALPILLSLKCDQKSIEWGHDNVHEFLKNYYGPQLVSLCKEKSVIVGGKEETISATEDLTVATNALVGADWSCIDNSRRQLCIWCACLLLEDAAEEPQVASPVLLSIYSDLLISPTFSHGFLPLMFHFSFQAEEKPELNYTTSF
ncbi:hypothetical protein Rs2_15301 [Raphanus sativus]|nr:hypothetical protein Rs2_15301 [Raphanus sativus]